MVYNVYFLQGRFSDAKVTIEAVYLCDSFRHCFQQTLFTGVAFKVKCCIHRGTLGIVMVISGLFGN